MVSAQYLPCQLKEWFLYTKEIFKAGGTEKTQVLCPKAHLVDLKMVTIIHFMTDILPQLKKSSPRCTALRI